MRTKADFFKAYPEKQKLVRVEYWPATQEEEAIAFCKKHKLRFTVRRRQLKGTNSGCPECGTEAMRNAAKMRMQRDGHPTKLTRQQAQARLKEKEIKIVGAYSTFSAKTQLRHSCGHEWTSSPQSAVSSKVGCPKCAKIPQGGYKKTLAKYVEECLEATDFTIKPLGYNGDGCAVQHECLTCGATFSKRPRHVLSGGSRFCPNCKNGPSAYSRASQIWIKRINKRARCATNGGEKSIIIDNRRYQVDGYCEKTKTIYEYLGDDWHGNPSVHRARSRPHPHSNATAARLLHATFHRMYAIAKHTGFKIVYVWESDFKHGTLVSGTLG